MARITPKHPAPRSSAAQHPTHTQATKPARSPAARTATGDQFSRPAQRPSTIDSPAGAPLATPRITPAWMGNTAVEIGREPSDHAKPADGFTFDTWARQRAGTTRFEFEVWAPGTTDRNNPDLWRDLDVEIHYRYAGQTEWKKDYVNVDGRSGNNAKYAVELRKFDPWMQHGLSSSQPVAGVPVSELTSADGRVTGHQAKLEFYFTVNGEELRKPSGEPFTGTYENY